MSDGFVLDTNVFIAAHTTHYRPSVFPFVWDRIDAAMHAGTIVSPRQVYLELTGVYDDGPSQWAKARRELFRVPPPEVQALIPQIDAAAPGLIKLTERNAADPWVVGFAMHLGFAVVTYEGIGPTGLPAPGKGMNIPKACNALGVECVLLADLFDALGPFSAPGA